MSSQMKGLLGIVLGLNAVFPIIILEIFNGRPGLVLGLGIPILLAISAYYFGRQAKNGGATVLGTLAVALGVVGMVIYTYNIFPVLSVRICISSAFC